ncbi:conserved Mce associated membrane protein [Mycobacterium tuberculosis]|nr:conserved Mce associated membrane protein [Mycobacterium tuberculosis]
MTKTRTADPAADEPEVRAEEPDARGEPAAPEPSAEESGEAAEKAAERTSSERPAEDADASDSETSAEDTGGGPDAKAPAEDTGGGPDPAASAEKTDAAPRRRLSKDPLIRIASLVTLVAAGAAAWFGWSYHAASGDDSLAYAAERDRVLAVAGQEIVNLNTLDYRQVDAGLKVWQDSATAQLYDQIVQGREQLKTEVQKAKTASSAKILESGLTELDTRAGKAAVIAAVRITITSADGKPVDNTRRMAGQLTRTSDGWKLSVLGQAPTGTP